MVQGPNYMKIDVICLKYRPDMMANAINMRITSTAKIGMAVFDKEWQEYTRLANFYAYYNIHQYKNRRGVHQMQQWCEQILRSQFGHSTDPYDFISLVHWAIDIGDGEQFRHEDNNIVPFHAIIKTPVMEHWYSHTNVDNNPNIMLAYTAAARRVPLFDEEDKAVQPYYHSNPDCSVLNKCTKFISCTRKIKSLPQIVLSQTEMLAEQVF